jgi:hemerythrin-like domain-containing protein
MNAIDELIIEHEAVRQALAILKSLGRRIKTTGKISSSDHVEQLFDFFSIFVDRCHHGKEEGLLFPLANSHLPAEELAAMHRGFDTLESEKIGAGQHEQFHRMLSELGNTYLQ